MTKSRATPRPAVAVARAAIARRDDDSGALKSSAHGKSFPGNTRDEDSGTSASWFVPPVVVPILLAVLIAISIIYQGTWQSLG
jgi:hypothetical protein